MSERTGFKFPEIKLDPSKIKDSWGLSAFLGTVFLVIALVCLSNPNIDKITTFVVLSLTISAIFVILKMTVRKVPERARFYARVTTKDIQIVGSAKDIREVLGDSIMDRGNENDA